MCDLIRANKCFSVAQESVNAARKKAPGGAILAYWSSKTNDVEVYASKVFSKAEQFQDKLDKDEKSTSVLLPLPEKNCVLMF